MSQNKDPEEFYAKLQKELEASTDWPSDYLYKFIVPSEPEKITQIKHIFNNMEAMIKTRDSSKGNYTSVSIHLEMASPKAVIEKYKEVGQKVKDVISL